LARFLLPILILALAVGGFLALRATRPAALPVQAQEKAWRVNTQVAAPAPHVPNLLLYGAVEAPREASLSAAVAADVIEVRVSEGEMVEAGRILVVLDQRDIALLLRQREADVAEIQASIDSERRRHRNDLIALERERAMVKLDEQAVDRLLDLQKRQVGAQSLVDDARQELERQALLLDERRRTVDDHPARMAQLEARLQRATALRDQAKLDLERTRIRAPFAGRVAQAPVAPGDRVRVGDLLIELYAVNELEIRAQIPFRYLGSVRTALADGSVLTAVSRVDGRDVRAALARLSGETARGVGGVDALFRITAGAEAVLPGRLLPLQLKLPAEADTVALPFSALYGLNRIYRMEQGRMTAVEVERVGERRDDDGEVRVLVRSPELRPGDQVIVTQLPNAVTGLKVSAVE
jgi:RND family efflux transporter MFP subunit